ncbi:MAG: hypothetical protein QMD97_03080, partial [Candidatus Aenigmarchaeota archaeon]|nr:hypothetical protein [Candidatus Aenigmarchaeota archaeon]
MASAYVSIQKVFGIELDWNEKVALSSYISSFSVMMKSGVPYAEAVHWFMIDYFGLDMYELGEIPIRTMKNGDIVWEMYGMNLLYDEN